MGGHAQLIDDVSPSSSNQEFFRTRSFLGVEEVRHSLVLETDRGRAALPVVIRPIPGTDLHDAVSPYGYPGGRLDGEPLDPAEIDFSSLEIVSVFVRDRLDAPTLSGGTDRNKVLVHDPASPRALSKSYRRGAARNLRDGWTTRICPGVEVDATTRAEFRAAYVETMQHVDASAAYFFEEDYLAACFDSGVAWLATVRTPDGEFAAGELVVRSDDVLHSFLAATRTRFRERSPGKNATLAALDLADDVGLRLNVGGGLRPGDGLEASKRHYTNTSTTFRTHELICRPDLYGELSVGCSDRTSYFPVYRAP